MKKPVTEYTDAEIEQRLAFADKLMNPPNGKAITLPNHLETERQELLAEQRRRRQCCKLCLWFDPDYAQMETEEESLGICEWPAERLPHSLRYGNRERLAVRPLEGTSCPTYEEKCDAT